MILTLTILAFGSATASLPAVNEPVQLFKVMKPSRVEQIMYVTKIVEHIMRMQHWRNQFDHTKCPEFSRRVCPKGKNCEAPKQPPSGPADICDLDKGVDSYNECLVDGTCYERGTCPIPLCTVEKDRLTAAALEESGPTKCSLGECQLPENKDQVRCREVTRCDIKEHEGHLEECKTDPNCDTNPDLCVNICDVTGLFSPCGYPMCYRFPHLPYCKQIPPPPVCPENTRPADDPNCCVGDECYEGFNRCEWGYKVGAEALQVLDQYDPNIKTDYDRDENLIYDCINKADIHYKKTLTYECFKNGIKEESLQQGDHGYGFTAIEKDMIEQHINNIKGDEYSATKHVVGDGHKVRVDLEKIQKETVATSSGSPEGDDKYVEVQTVA